MRRLTDEAVGEFSEFFGVNFLKTFTPKKKKNNGKMLILADLHFPFHNEKLLQETIKKNKDADTLFIAGDIFDMFDMSPFRKTMYMPFKEEFGKAMRHLQILCMEFPEVKIMLTNHDKRPYKRLYDSVLPNLLKFCHTNLLEELIGLIPNLSIISQNALGREIGYLAQEKNIIFTHIEKSNADITKTVQEIHKTIKLRWEEAYKLNHYNIVMQAHNHSAGQVWMNNTLLAQIPCMIDISAPAFDYVFDGKVKGNPPALGYATIQYNGFDYDPNTLQIYKFQTY